MARPERGGELLPGASGSDAGHGHGLRQDTRGVAAALLALLGLEAALLVALAASAQPGDPPEPDPLPEVRYLSEVIRNAWDTAAEAAEETGATPELEYIVWCEGGRRKQHLDAGITAIGENEMKVYTYIATEETEVIATARALEKAVRRGKLYWRAKEGTHAEERAYRKFCKWESRYFGEARKLGLSFDCAYNLLDRELDFHLPVTGYWSV